MELFEYFPFKKGLSFVQQLRPKSLKSISLKIIMKRHRFFVQEKITGKNFLLVDRETVNQIKNVLRCRAGETIALFSGDGREAICEITDVGKEAIAGRVINVINWPEKKTRVELFSSLLKKENFELVVEKATEVGIDRIIPVIARRTVKLNYKKDRLLKIIKEASEQSGRMILPELAEPLDFQAALEAAAANDLNYFFDLSAEEGPASQPADIGSIGIFIGPEGGWDETEIKAVRERKNFVFKKIGRLTLRAETAAIIASYLAANQHA